MIKRITVSIMLLTGMYAAVTADRIPYKNPTGGEFPILAWYSVLPESNLTPQRYAELRNAGFNISFSHFASAAQAAEGLKACKGTGVKLMMMCPEIEANTAEVVNRFKDDEMVAGWFLRDEPTAHGFKALREFRDRVYEADRNHTVYLNLLPSLVSAEALGTKNYEEYVQRFVDEVALPQISYDFYPIVEEGGKTYVRPSFYENLETVRNVAARNGMPFWAFVLSTAHDPYPTPTSVHMRLEAFSALAYGAQCIQYFTYWTPERTVWNFHNAPVAKDGRRTHVYYLVKELNNEIRNLTWVFLGAKAVNVGHTGKELPLGTRRPEQLPAPFSRIEADGQGLLISHLENGAKHFLMIVNRDIDNAQNVEIEKTGKVRKVLPNGTQRKIRAKDEQRLTLEPGGYVIYRFD